MITYYKDKYKFICYDSIQAIPVIFQNILKNQYGKRNPDEVWFIWKNIHHWAFATVSNWEQDTCNVTGIIGRGIYNYTIMEFLIDMCKRKNQKRIVARIPKEEHQRLLSMLGWKKLRDNIMVQCVV